MKLRIHKTQKHKKLKGLGQKTQNHDAYRVIPAAKMLRWVTELHSFYSMSQKATRETAVCDISAMVAFRISHTGLSMSYKALKHRERQWTREDSSFDISAHVAGEREKRGVGSGQGTLALSWNNYSLWSKSCEKMWQGRHTCQLRTLKKLEVEHQPSLQSIKET